MKMAHWHPKLLSIILNSKDNHHGLIRNNKVCHILAMVKVGGNVSLGHSNSRTNRTFIYTLDSPSLAILMIKLGITMLVAML